MICGNGTTPVPTPSSDVDPNADLENLTPQQLAELSKQIADELARRASAQSAG